MGQISAKLFDKHPKLILLGLECSGKTAILYKLKLNETIKTIPTIGTNTEDVFVAKLHKTVEVVDVGGNQKLRPLWKFYIGPTSLHRHLYLTYVIDSSEDEESLARDKIELHKLIQSNQKLMKRTKLLIFANKQDKTDARSIDSIAESLQISKILSSNQYKLQPCSATTGDGLQEGIQWLVTHH